MRKHKSIEYLAIASWNINGLHDKVQDDAFIRKFDNHDIVFLSETHLNDNEGINVPGFRCHQFNLYKQKSNGKIDGGIAMLCRLHLSQGITVVDKSNPDYVWFRLEKSFFGLENNLYICAAYLPHENSCYITQSENDVLDSLELDIGKYAQDGYILIIGDLNARTSTISDHITHDQDNSLVDGQSYIIDENISCRKNQDTVINRRGTRLGELCVQCRIRILNGRTLGDTQGHFTCHRPQGSSTIDYMIMSEELLHRVQYFQVHSKLDLSDHCMISMQMRSHINRLFTTNTITMSPMPTTFKWDENSIQRYQDALTDTYIYTQLQKLTNYPHDNTEQNTDTAVQMLNNALLQAASKSLLEKKQKPKSLTRNKPWFNTSLKHIRRKVCAKGELLRHFPNDPLVRGSYYKSLKEYNRARKHFKRQYKQDIINQLDDLREKAPQQYWKLLHKLKDISVKNEATTQITPSEWLSHFRNLNTKPTTAAATTTYSQTHNMPKIDPQPLNMNIEECEVLIAIKNLKNGKATGLDGISNEMIKYGQHILIKPLTKIFNAVLQSGLYPQTWAKGYISPIFKTGNPLEPNNYRGITISSCIAKVFNTVLNNRLEKYLTDNNIIHETQIAFKRNNRTSDHMFVLRTLVDKIVKSQKKKMYTCFVDFQKAFDSLPHDAVLHKLLNIGINGKFHDTIQDMYRKTSLQVKLEGQLTPSFPAEVGVRQGDVLSPNIFKIFINDLPNTLSQNDTEAPTLGSKHINSLLYADDLVLLSTTQAGLQASLDKLMDYCHKWGLHININKTKVIIFKPQRCLSSELFTIGTQEIENVDEYKYLGVTFDSQGTFKPAQTSLYQKGLKAYFSMTKMLSSERTGAKTILHLFDHTVKPILLYASEIWGTLDPNLRRIKNNPEIKLEKAYDKLKAENIHMKLCRFILGVNPKTSLAAVRGETGRFPLYLEIILNILKYYHHLTNTSSDLLRQAFNTNNDLLHDGGKCWLSWAHTAMQEAGLDMTKIQEPISRWLPQARKTLYIKYESHWINQLTRDSPPNQQGNKLRTYRKFKSSLIQEAYLNILTDRNLRKSIARLRTSSHKLHIETGRYFQTPLEHRTCNNCGSGEIEDEQHFITTCHTYTEERQTLYDTIKSTCPNFTNLNGENKMIWLLTTENPDIVRAVAKFTKTCFEKRFLNPG